MGFIASSFSFCLWFPLLCLSFSRSAFDPLYLKTCLFNINRNKTRREQKMRKEKKQFDQNQCIKAIFECCNLLILCMLYMRWHCVIKWILCVHFYIHRSENRHVQHDSIEHYWCEISMCCIQFYFILPSCAAHSFPNTERDGKKMLTR